MKIIVLIMIIVALTSGCAKDFVIGPVVDSEPEVRIQYGFLLSLEDICAVTQACQVQTYYLQ